VINTYPASHLGHSGSTVILTVGDGTFEYDGMADPARQIDSGDPAIQFG
jgi:hypothetical protein